MIVIRKDRDGFEAQYTVQPGDSFRLYRRNQYVDQWKVSLDTANECITLMEEPVSYVEAKAMFDRLINFLARETDAFVVTIEPSEVN